MALNTGVTKAPAFRPKVISVRSQSIGSAQPGWNSFTVTIPGGQTMPDTEYSVVFTCHEFGTDFGNAVLQPAEAVPQSPNTFKVRINSNWNAALPCFIDYTVTQVTPSLGNQPVMKYAGDASWQTPTLTNGWTNFGSGYAPAQFRKLPTGEVEIQGLVRSGTGDGLFVLPAGYRPGGQLIFATATDPNVFGRLDVNPDGWVVRSIGSATWFSLNCKFYADL